MKRGKAPAFPLFSANVPQKFPDGLKYPVKGCEAEFRRRNGSGNAPPRAGRWFRSPGFFRSGVRSAVLLLSPVLFILVQQQESEDAGHLLRVFFHAPAPDEYQSAVDARRGIGPVQVRGIFHGKPLFEHAAGGHLPDGLQAFFIEHHVIVFFQLGQFRRDDSGPPHEFKARRGIVLHQGVEAGHGRHAFFSCLHLRDGIPYLVVFLLGHGTFKNARQRPLFGTAHGIDRLGCDSRFPGDGIKGHVGVTFFLQLADSRLNDALPRVVGLFLPPGGMICPFGLRLFLCAHGFSCRLRERFPEIAPVCAVCRGISSILPLQGVYRPRPCVRPASFTPEAADVRCK